jgi:hypothetical protein
MHSAGFRYGSAAAVLTIEWALRKALGL